MRVLHLVPYFQPGYLGGIQRYVAELATRQARDGVQAAIFTVVLKRSGGQAAEGGPWRQWGLEECGVPVIARRAWSTFMRTPVSLPVFPRGADVKADLVHLHGPSPWFDAALLWARGRWPVKVLTVHNSFPAASLLQRWLTPVGLALFRRTLTGSDRVIASHPEFLQELAGGDLDRSLAAKVRFVPPGVEHGRFFPGGPPGDPASVLFAAHIRPEKGLHVLVQAMRGLPHLTLDVLGTVSYESTYFRRVRDDALRWLGDRVRFRLNPTQDELALAYRQAGCVAVPSLGLESWNLVLLEAAASGAPCVRTAIPGLAWAKFAIAVPANRPAELAASIRQAVSNRAELGAQSIRAASQYSWERTHRETIDVYRAALEGRR